jgi:hypothetical protein
MPGGLSSVVVHEIRPSQVIFSPFPPWRERALSVLEGIETTMLLRPGSHAVWARRARGASDGRNLNGSGLSGHLRAVGIDGARSLRLNARPVSWKGFCTQRIG